jgi:hypothetical protein
MPEGPEITINSGACSGCFNSKSIFILFIDIFVIFPEGGGIY